MSDPQRAEVRSEFAENLEKARVEAGRREGRELSYSHLQKEMGLTFGTHVPTAQSVANYHLTATPERANLEWVEWFAERYGIAASSLHPVIAERLGPARTLLSRSRCVSGIDMPDGQMRLRLETYTVPVGVERRLAS